MAAGPGNIALLSQSGAIATSLIDWAAENDVGFSHIVSLRDMADVDVGDWSRPAGRRCEDPRYRDVPRKHPNRASLCRRPAPPHGSNLSLRSSRDFTRRQQRPQRRIPAHCPVLTASSTPPLGVLVSFACRRTGRAVRRRRDHGTFAPLERARVGIVTNGGGAGVLAVDRLVDGRASLQNLPPKRSGGWTQRCLRPGRMATRWTSSATPRRHDTGPRLKQLRLTRHRHCPRANCPTGLASPAEAASAVAGLTSKAGLRANPSLLAGWVNTHGGAPVTSCSGRGGELRDAGGCGDRCGLPRRLVACQKASDARAVEPQRGHQRRSRVGVAIFRKAAKDGRCMLTEPEAKAALAA